MQYIEFSVQHQTITRTDKYKVVGGSQNYLRARFTFCDEWEGITATAVFSTNSGKHYSVLIEDGECLVPWEVLGGAEFWVGVFGGERMTTSTARVAVKPGVKLNASPGVEPTPTAYERLVGIVAESAAAAESAKIAAEESAEEATGAAAELKDELEGVKNALDNLPEGSTVVVNDLTTGGTKAALSAEMGKELGQRVSAAERLPRLTDEQKKQLKNLVSLYTVKATRERFYYSGSTLRNSYLSPNAFYDASRVKVNCGLFCGLLWAGVHPDTFVKYLDNQAEYTGLLEKYFDWGYEFRYPNRKAFGLTRSSGETLGLLKPNADSYIGASSFNSYYSPDSEREDKQKFYTYATAADMAWELYANGYEIQMKDIDVGDLLFFRARNLSDTMDDYDEAIRFRNITHVGMVSAISVVEGQKVWSIAESTSMIGTGFPVANLEYSSLTATTVARLASLNNKICMVARHPSAFGVASNLGEKFTEI